MDASPLEIRDAIIGHWHNNYTRTPTEYMNSLLDDDIKKKPFVRFDIRFTTSNTIFKGNVSGATLTRHRGRIFVEIHKHPQTGNREHYDIATEVCAVLERKRIGSVVTYNAELRELNFGDGYYTLIVEVPFTTS